MSCQTTANPRLALENESRVNIHTFGAIQELLSKLAAVDREALRRYYVDEGTSEQVCQAMNITSTRFRVARSSLVAAVTTKGKLMPMKLPKQSGNRTARSRLRAAPTQQSKGPPDVDLRRDRSQ